MISSYSRRGISKPAKCFRGISQCCISQTQFNAFCNWLGMCQRVLNCLIFFLTFDFVLLTLSLQLHITLRKKQKKKKKKTGPRAYLLSSDLFVSYKGNREFRSFHTAQGLSKNPLGLNPSSFTYQLCDFEQVTFHSCALVLSPRK